MLREAFRKRVEHPAVNNSIFLVRQIAAGNRLPDALFCQNDEIALGAYRALRENGSGIPGEIALAGCDDLPFDPYLDTPLTSLRLPVAEVCR